MTVSLLAVVMAGLLMTSIGVLGLCQAARRTWRHEDAADLRAAGYSEEDIARMNRERARWPY